MRQSVGQALQDNNFHDQAHPFNTMEARETCKQNASCSLDAFDALLFRRTDSASSSVSFGMSALDDILSNGALNSPLPSANVPAPGAHASTTEVEHAPASFRPGDLVELLPERLYFTIHSTDEQSITQIAQHPQRFYFSSELQEQYESFCEDWGPVNLGTVHEFCKLMHSRMSDKRLRNRQIVYYFGEAFQDQSNAAFLLAAYLVLIEGLTPDQACAPFNKLGKPWSLIGFRDATFHPADFLLSLHDLMRGLCAAMRLGWYRHSKFNLDEYTFFDHPRNGDMHEVIPGRFLAFKGPDVRVGGKGLTAQQYATSLARKGVKTVIRLNDECTYDPQAFTQVGIRHYECYFDDCSVPPFALVKRFLDICDHEQGLVAVHCLAGLGRTGTLIALWMMRTHRLSARECISWLRICRPGSVIGPQQHFLVACEGAEWLRDNTMILSSRALAAQRTASANLSSSTSAQLARQVSEATRRRDEMRCVL